MNYHQFIPSQMSGIQILIRVIHCDNWSGLIFIHVSQFSNHNFISGNLHIKVLENRTITNYIPLRISVKGYLLSRLVLLSAGYVRFIMPHIYKFGNSIELLNLREQLRKEIGNSNS